MIQVAIAQPNARPIPEEIIHALIDRAAPGTPDEELLEVVYRDQHSNDVAAVHFADGRTLMVKRGRYAWSAERFGTSRRASELLRREAGILAPAPLPLPPGLGELPVEAYWRIGLPTLDTLWPHLSDRARVDALRSWGELLDRIHRVRLPGYGPLPADGEPSLQGFLQRDLATRLLPAVEGVWPAGSRIVEQLLELLPLLVDRVGSETGRLLHNDLHMDNVLCEVGEQIRCVGLLDLETCVGGPPEADLASLQVHHQEPFARPLHGPWFEHVMEGYQQPVDRWAVVYYRAYHMVNMGFHSALIGHAAHAGRIADSALAEVKRLSAPWSHRQPAVA